MFEMKPTLAHISLTSRREQVSFVYVLQETRSSEHKRIIDLWQEHARRVRGDPRMAATICAINPSRSRAQKHGRVCVCCRMMQDATERRTP
eukprot:5881338-Amphidinium_carterae.1